MSRSPLIHLLMVVCLGVAGCDTETSREITYDPSQDAAAYNIPPDFDIIFKDNVQSNTEPGVDPATLTFVNVDGEAVKLKDYIGKMNVVLVITRGGTDQICTYCSTQTSRLISRYKDIAAHDAEVVLIYPVAKEAESSKLDEFLKATKEKLNDPGTEVPFPLFLDVDLVAVEELQIRASLSKPATYILDKNGKTRFSYVGNSVEDRPSVDAIIEQLNQLGQES